MSENQMNALEQCLLEISLGLQSDGADLSINPGNQPGTYKISVSGISKGCKALGVNPEDSIRNYVEKAGLDISSIEFVPQDR